MMNTVNEKKFFNFQLDPSFVEEAIFLYAREFVSKEEGLIADFHRAREAIYLNTSTTLSVNTEGPAGAECVKDYPSEERDRLFRALAADYFRKMGLQDRLETILRDFPLLSGPDILILIKRVWIKKQEEVELFVRERHKTVCIGLQTIRILDMSFLESFLRHELMHISDMLDPRFEYDPCLPLKGETEPAQEIIRQRFHILWDIYINARLARQGLLITSEFQKRNSDSPLVSDETKRGGQDRHQFRCDPRASFAKQSYGAQREDSARARASAYLVNFHLAQQREILEKFFFFWDNQKKETVLKQITTQDNCTHKDLLELAQGSALSEQEREGGCQLCLEE